MAQEIYHLFLAKPTEAWYQLSEEEQNQLLAKVAEALTQVGGKSIVNCNSSWSSEQWHFWGVEQYPNIEALQKHTELLNAVNWFRYVESMTLQGTEIQPS